MQQRPDPVPMAVERSIVAEIQPQPPEAAATTTTTVRVGDHVRAPVGEGARVDAAKLVAA